MTICTAAEAVSVNFEVSTPDVGLSKYTANGVDTCVRRCPTSRYSAGVIGSRMASSTLSMKSSENRATVRARPSKGLPPLLVSL
ncbi:hypothetical protein [Nocardia arizonensis]|uniref:hypothetical protein n=1 Tax=Nocardia arizonensis TaxID=1141647 RepID=UPI0006D05336|nr:hypothetical protein [Nocardia arizonensis]